MSVVVFAVLCSLIGLTGQGRGAASQPADPVMARLLGRWEGTGTILKQPSTVRMEWAAALDGQFVRLTFQSLIGAEPRSQRFEGHAYYKGTTPAQFVATWFDSSGTVRPIAATSTSDELAAAWGTVDTELGETVYRILSDGRLEVVDRVKGKDGAWREFGRSNLTRAP